MKSHWNANLVRGKNALDLLVYRSRLIGREESLGLWGGGNTSIKCVETDLFGRAQEVLWVKGSGSNLKDCEAHNFSPLPLAVIRKLARRRRMGNEEIMVFLEHCLLRPRAPRPSIETLLHAFVPEVAIDHTHADVILSLANTKNGFRLVRKVLGPDLLWIPYIRPGLALFRCVFEACKRNPKAHGAVLEKHGLITWGPDGRTSYLRTIRFVSKAERFLAQSRRRRKWSAAGCTALTQSERMALLQRLLPAIRRTVSHAGKMCVTYFDNREVMEFVNAKKMPEVAATGPATPDHMLRTRRLPLVVALGGRSAANLSVGNIMRQFKRYAMRHKEYFRKYRQRGQALRDPYPRVILIPGVGMLTTGKDATETAMVAQIYSHTMAVMRNASTVGRYTSVSEREAFAVEYWPMELYKLSLAPPEAELAREVGLITGAAGGIGRAVAEQLVAMGASVIVTDVDRRSVEDLAGRLNERTGRRCALGLALDVTSEKSVQKALEQALKVFGGVDFLVSNAGVARISAIDQLQQADWEWSFRVNATGHFLVGRAVIQLLRAQGLGGTLVFVASKNVLAPGKEFGAYSAAKAAETQLARVLAIENGEFGIRVNIVNPDGVFEGSGLWRGIKASRAKTYRLSPDRLETYYQKRNLLKARVLPQDVGEAVGFLVSRRSAKTTGCILTVDGGLREAFPR